MNKEEPWTRFEDSEELLAFFFHSHLFPSSFRFVSFFSLVCVCECLSRALLRCAEDEDGGAGRRTFFGLVLAFDKGLGSTERQRARERAGKALGKRWEERLGSFALGLTLGETRLCLVWCAAVAFGSGWQDRGPRGQG